MKQHIFRLFILIVFCGSASTFNLSADDSSDQVIYKDKTAKYDYTTQVGTITLENFLPGSSSVIQEAKPLDAILVLDFSGSMTDSYSPSESYNRIESDKKYSYVHYGSSSDGDKSDVDFVAQNYDFKNSAKHNVLATYNGAQYQLKLIRRAGSVPTSSGTDKAAHRMWLYIEVGGKRIYVTPDGGFVKASSTSPATSSITFAKSGWPIGEDNNTIPPTTDIDGKYKQLFCTYKTTSGTTNKRMYALEKAVGAFIDSVAVHTKPGGLVNRIAVVSYTGGSYYEKLYANTQMHSDTYRSETNYLNSSYDNYLVENTYDYSFNTGGPTWTTKMDNHSGLCQVLKRFVDMSSPNAANILKHSITGLTKDGNTPTHAGVKIAKELMNSWGRATDAAGKDVARYIIVFSDGKPTIAQQTPGSSSITVSDSFDGGTGETAVSTMYDLKHSSTKPCIVYSVYCPASGQGGSTDYGSNGAMFMQRLSSDYPDAKTCFAGTQKESSEFKYFKLASSNLTEVFNQITSQIIVDVNEKYGVNTVVADFVNNQYFKLPDNATVNDIKCYENACTGAPDVMPTTPTKEGYTWAADSTLRTDLTVYIGRSATAQDTIMVSGYNFTDNWCGWRIATSSSSKTIHGNRLLIKIPFTLKNNVSFGDLETNTGESGVYIQPKDSTGYKKDTEYPVPKIPFCKLVITRSGLHNGESAIYLVKDDKGSVIDKVSLNGNGDPVVSRTLYGAPGITFSVEETGWNWAYDKDPSGGSLTKTAPTTGTDAYIITFPFAGDHRNPSAETDPANLHNHDEAYVRNKFTTLPTVTE